MQMITRFTQNMITISFLKRFMKYFNDRENAPPMEKYCLHFLKQFHEKSVAMNMF